MRPVPGKKASCQQPAPTAAEPPLLRLRWDSLILTPSCPAPGSLRPERASPPGYSVPPSGRAVETHHSGPPRSLATEGTPGNSTVAGRGERWLIEQ